MKLRAVATALLLTTVAVLLVVGASPASAHAVLQGTSPPSGATVATSPDAVTLSFSESVEVSLGSLRLFDDSGHQVSTGSLFRPAGDSTVGLHLPRLNDGGYILTWRVISADAHPVHGAFTFDVGTGSAAGGGTDAVARKLVAADAGPRSVGVAFGVVRFLAFAALAVVVGGLAFLFLLWPEGLARGGAGRRVVSGAFAVLVVATVVGIPMQGVYGAGLGLGRLVDGRVLGDALHTRFGVVWAGRGGLLVAGAAWFVGATRLPRPAQHRPALAIGALLGLALVATPGLAGHASTGRWTQLGLVADTVHVGAMSFWLGGLTLLVAAALPSRDEATLRRVVPAFSRWAFVAVVVIVVSGTFQSWRQLGAVAAILHTTYGRLLVIKLGLVVAMVAVAAASRRWVRSGRTDLRGLRRDVAAEVALAAAILVVTALLVDATPGREALALPYSTELTTSTLLIDVTIDPAKAGPAAVHVYTITPSGTQQPVEELRATLTLPSQDIGPLEVPLTPAGPGHYAAYGFRLPLPGTWQLSVTARLTDIDEVTATATVPVR